MPAVPGQPMDIHVGGVVLAEGSFYFFPFSLFIQLRQVARARRDTEDAERWGERQWGWRVHDSQVPHDRNAKGEIIVSGRIGQVFPGDSIDAWAVRPQQYAQ
ncbi:hypothetical protein AQI88_15680 [Streptomyces cellostaticus]|uniref:Uncharacterized protein n=1 Tax=Streptomyces cellostaticus TaxID=67285 RepID=A0A101NM23_9ACTN|nr:hypothetical protein AQI88_15680 [Streptomyces cellostaticus]